MRHKRNVKHLKFMELRQSWQARQSYLQSKALKKAKKDKKAKKQFKKLTNIDEAMKNDTLMQYMDVCVLRHHLSLHVYLGTEKEVDVDHDYGMGMIKDLKK